MDYFGQQTYQSYWRKKSLSHIILETIGYKFYFHYSANTPNIKVSAKHAKRVLGDQDRF